MGDVQEQQPAHHQVDGSSWLPKHTNYQAFLQTVFGCGSITLSCCEVSESLVTNEGMEQFAARL